MSAEKDAMQAAIQRALDLPANYDPNNAAQIRTTLARDIANAVDAYVLVKLGTLKAALVVPGAFTGAGTGTVVVSPGTIGTYTP
jgi:hypothetical protein